MLILVLGLAGLQVASRSRLGLFFARPVLESDDYALFTNEIKTLLLLICLGVLFLLLQIPRPSQMGSQQAPEPGGRPKVWSAAFLLTVGMLVSFVLYVNPDGRLPWNRREVYIAIPSRSIKPVLYSKLSNTPDVIMFGSSVTFTMPADYFKQTWGLDAFNMSVSGGTPSDFLDMLNFILTTSPEQDAPSLVTIELLWRDLRPATGVDFPLGLLPYMDFSRGVKAVLGMLDYPLQMSSASDSLFTLLFVETGRWENAVIFAPDGTAYRTQATLPPTDYRKNIKNEIPLQKRLLACRELDPTGMQYIEEIAALGERYHFAILIYAPPVNEDFYKYAKVEPRRFGYCRSLVNNYMRDLVGRHPNVFYRDLVNYVPISSLGRQIYLDPRHLTSEGNLLLLETLKPKINQALRWARQNR